MKVFTIAGALIAASLFTGIARAESAEAAEFYENQNGEVIETQYIETSDGSTYSYTIRETRPNWPFCTPKQVSENHPPGVKNPPLKHKCLIELPFGQVKFNIREI